MKQSLQLRIGHQLTMTPQLQQAIRLLQLSTIELHMEIQQTLDSNLMLETVDEEDPETQTADSPPEAQESERFSLGRVSRIASIFCSTVSLRNMDGSWGK